jgi:hypothetical protein
MPSIELTDDQLESLRSVFSEDPPTGKPRSFPDGKLFIRTVTFHLIGRVVGQIGEFIELADATCVFDSGSLSGALTTGKLATAEAVGRCYVNRNSITDMFPWKHDLK